MSWLDALLGTIWDDGTPVELGGGIDFKTGLAASYNPVTKRVEVTAAGGASQELIDPSLQGTLRGVDAPDIGNTGDGRIGDIYATNVSVTGSVTIDGTDVLAHIEDTANPHEVTAEQTGAYTEAEVNALFTGYYTSAQTDAKYVAKAGDTMTGALLSQGATALGDATTGRFGSAYCTIVDVSGNFNAGTKVRTWVPGTDTKFIADSSANCIIDCVAGSANVSIYGFSDTDASLRGQVRYSHAAERFEFSVAGSIRAYMNSSAVYGEDGIQLGIGTAGWAGLYLDDKTEPATPSAGVGVVYRTTSGLRHKDSSGNVAELSIAKTFGAITL